LEYNHEIKFMTKINVEKPELCCSINVPDTSTQCIRCGSDMTPEHAHYRCYNCGERDSCCEGVY
jgi:hypothetical protein